MRVSWLMLDGVGLLETHDRHPFSDLFLPTLQHLGVTAVSHSMSKNFVVRALDANLGIEGLPQSGTGQTTILTGINASAALGFHHGPWVSPSLKPILEHSVLKRLGSVRLANYYPAQYKLALEQGKRRLNAIATSALAAGASLEAENGLGISPLLRPYEASSGNPKQIREWAKNFMYSKSNVTIFDLWWTDSVGHEMDLLEAQALAMRLEQFCAACLEFQQPDSLFLITSDHGNFEDLRIKTHTRNPVPLAAVGIGAEHFANAKSLIDIAAALEAAFT